MIGAFLTIRLWPWELRLAGAATLAEGNALLPAFIADYNARFGKAPENPKDLHRPLRLGEILTTPLPGKKSAPCHRR
jgi:hypothetical protein